MSAKRRKSKRMQEDDNDDVRILDDRWYLDRLGFNRSRLYLKEGENSIGRDIHSKIVVNSPFASRRHCIITLREGILGLEDLNSFNGTFVNDEEVKGRSREVCLGDVIAIGGLMKEEDIEFRSDAFMFRLRNEGKEADNDRHTLEFEENIHPNAPDGVQIKEEEPPRNTLASTGDVRGNETDVIEIKDEENLYSMQILSQISEDVQEVRLIKTENTDYIDDGEKTVVDFGKPYSPGVIDLISDDDEDLDKNVGKWLSRLSQSQHKEVLIRAIKSEPQEIDEELPVEELPEESHKEKENQTEDKQEKVILKDLRVILNPIEWPIEPIPGPSGSTSCQRSPSPDVSSDDEIIPPKKRRYSMFSSAESSPSTFCEDDQFNQCDMEMVTDDITISKCPPEMVEVMEADQSDALSSSIQPEVPDPPEMSEMDQAENFDSKMDDLDPVDPRGLLERIEEKTHHKKCEKKSQHRQRDEKKKEEKRDAGREEKKKEEKKSHKKQEIRDENKSQRKHDKMDDKKKERKQDKTDEKKSEKRHEKKEEKKSEKIHVKKDERKSDSKDTKTEKKDEKYKKTEPSVKPTIKPSEMLKQAVESITVPTRKAPELIPAPKKRRRNSLRGFCASEMGRTEKKVSLGTVLKQNEVKSVPDIKRNKEIKETRREMLKNLAMGGGEEKRSIPTNAPAKIKLTWENRGNFLTEVLPKKPIPTRRQSLDAALLAADSVYAAPKKIKDRRKTINTADDHVARNELDQNEGNDDIDVDLGILPEFSGDFPASYGTHIRHKKRIAHTPKYVEPSVQEESVEAAESNRVSTIKFAEPLEAIFELCPSPAPEEIPTDVPYLTLNCVKDEVTKWNPLWLKHNNYSKMDLINPSTALLRIGNTFDSFSSYLDTMIPLMMLELWAQIMKQVHIPQGQQTERLLLNIASVTRNGGRFVIKTQNITGKPPNIQIGDLVVLECQYQRRILKFFVHTKNIEPDGREVTFETAFLNLDCSIENTLAHVEPIMNITYVLMEFEYVFNLENSPLYRTILDSTMLRHEDEDVSQKKANAHFEYCGRDALNPTQMTTIEKVSAQCLNPRGTISLIQGGPGTGKSRIIANLVFQLLLHHNQLFPDMKILVCARSNAAVDYLAAQMMDIKRELNKNFHIVRFGVESRFSANVKCISHEEHAKAYKQGMISVKDNPEYRKLYEVKLKQFEGRLKELEKPHEERFCAPPIDAQEEMMRLKAKILDLRRYFNGEDFGRDFIMDRVMERAKIICATLSSCGNIAKFGVDSFDVCIVDEASQATESWTLAPLKFGVSSLILVGDSLQHPATGLSKEAMQHGLGQSLFKRLSLSQTIPIHYLTEQYRMHPEIWKFPNEYFYRNRLSTHPMAIDSSFPWKPYGVFSLEFTPTPTSNRTLSIYDEANFVSTLIKIITTKAPLSQYSYGIITPYNGNQNPELVQSIAEISKDILISTVEGYQGHERDIIIISLAKTDGLTYLANNGFISALTRAKKCLFVCGNFITHQQTDIGHLFVNDAKARKLFYIVNSCTPPILQSFITK